MCASSFNQEALLKKHIQRHIDGRYMACPMPNCNKAFSIKHHLTKHLRNAHANKTSPSSPPRRISGKRAISASGRHLGKTSRTLVASVLLNFVVRFHMVIKIGDLEIHL
ncbi:Zinc finger and BTB domain-containing protein 22, partial [Pseudolycoriella hygida]